MKKTANQKNAKMENIENPKATFTDIFKQNPSQLQVTKAPIRIKPLKKASFMDIIKSPSSSTEQNVKEEAGHPVLQVIQERQLRRQDIPKEPMKGLRSLEPRGMRRSSVGEERREEKLLERRSWQENKPARMWKEGERRSLEEDQEVRRSYRPITARSVGDSAEGGSHLSGTSGFLMLQLL